MRKLLREFIPLIVVVALEGCSLSTNKETTVKSEVKAGQAVELKRQGLI